MLSGKRVAPVFLRSEWRQLSQKSEGIKSTHDPVATHHKEAQQEEEKKIEANENAIVSQIQDPAPVQPDRSQNAEPAATHKDTTKRRNYSRGSPGVKMQNAFEYMRKHPHEPILMLPRDTELTEKP